MSPETSACYTGGVVPEGLKPLVFIDCGRHAEAVPFANRALPEPVFEMALNKLTMPSRYAQWMYDWEHRLTSVDNNRVVRPLDWGLEFARDWPCRNGWQPGQAEGDPAKFLVDFNRRIVASSDELDRKSVV